MGCGSSIYNDDGSVKVGQGTAKIELDDQTKVHVYFNFGDHHAKNVKTYFKKVIVGLDGLKAKYTEEGVHDAGNNGFWIEAEPGVYMQQFRHDGAPMPYPRAITADIPAKLYLLHSKDKTKLPKLLKKDCEKNAEHPYNDKATGDKTLEDDLESFKHLRTVHQIPDRVGKLKEALVLMEDNIPMNATVIFSAVDYGFGQWDDAEGKPFERQLGLADKAREIAEAKLGNSAIQQKIVCTKDEILRTTILKAMDGACAAIGVKRDTFLPTMEPALDAAAEARPGNAPKEKDPNDKGTERTPEEIETALQERIKQQWAIDKSQIQHWHNSDAEDIHSRKKHFENHVSEAMKAIAEAPFKSEKGAFCVALYNGKAYSEAIVDTVNGSNISVTFPATKTLKEDTLTHQPKAKYKITRGTEEVEEEFSNFLGLPEPLDFSYVQPNLSVRVRRALPDKKPYFCNAVVEFADPSSKTAIVKDRFNESFTVTNKDIWYATNVADAARRAWVLPTNFSTLTVWWICPEDDVERTFQLWRESAKEDSLERITFKKRFSKAKPTKINPEPTHEVFIGYAATIKVLPYRVYNFSYKIGEDTYLDFGKKAHSPDAYRRLVLKSA